MPRNIFGYDRVIITPFPIEVRVLLLFFTFFLLGKLPKRKIYVTVT